MKFISFRYKSCQLTKGYLPLLTKIHFWFLCILNKMLQILLVLFVIKSNYLCRRQASLFRKKFKTWKYQSFEFTALPNTGLKIYLFFSFNSLPQPGLFSSLWSISRFSILSFLYLPFLFWKKKKKAMHAAVEFQQLLSTWKKINTKQQAKSKSVLAFGSPASSGPTVVTLFGGAGICWGCQQR